MDPVTRLVILTEAGRSSAWISGQQPVRVISGYGRYSLFRLTLDHAKQCGIAPEPSVDQVSFSIRCEQPDRPSRQEAATQRIWAKLAVIDPLQPYLRLKKD